jgi:type 1 glutamine amidotransferase
MIDSASLAAFDLVIFFTSGDLTIPGTDGEPPMAASGEEDLLDWIESGGGFIGFHSASTTFPTVVPEPVSPYLAALGGEFDQHGTQFSGTLRTYDASHPAIAGFPAAWFALEEWYLFKFMDWTRVHALALFDPGNEGQIQPMYDVDPFPLVWCTTLGSGRIYYTGLAHNATTWSNAEFRASITAAIDWALGVGATQAGANFRETSHVDFSHSGTENGEPDTPFSSVTGAAGSVRPNGLVTIAAGESAETVSIARAMQIHAISGTVRIGTTARRTTGFVAR